MKNEGLPHLLHKTRREKEDGGNIIQGSLPLNQRNPIEEEGELNALIIIDMAIMLETVKKIEMLQDPTTTIIVASTTTSSMTKEEEMIEE